MTILEEELKSANVDLGAIEEWQRKDADYRGRLSDLEAATRARNQAQPMRFTTQLREFEESYPVSICSQ